MLLPDQFNANGTLYLSNQIQDEIDVTILNARKQLHIICVYVYMCIHQLMYHILRLLCLVIGPVTGHRPHWELLSVCFYFIFLECGCVGFKYKSKFYLRIATKVAN